MTTPFARLVARACRRAAPKDCQPIPVRVMARRCKVSRPFLYFLMAGKRAASPEKVETIAEGLGVSAEVVARTIARSQR